MGLQVEKYQFRPNGWLKKLLNINIIADKDRWGKPLKLEDILRENRGILEKISMLHTIYSLISGIKKNPTYWEPFVGVTKSVSDMLNLGIFTFNEYVSKYGRNNDEINKSKYVKYVKRKISKWARESGFKNELVEFIKKVLVPNEYKNKAFVVRTFENSDRLGVNRVTIVYDRNRDTIKVICRRKC